ncbi:TlpA disulfide reductase family protein [Pedobacter nyackensis]|uniref:Peroxiredoxin n=1 Tax=Pedobacter nyackensis TaxID=475255 RepID=A0A1W2AC40_9SPHI|nr:TlpA disulfide reductase family protein [Pedobacter nyackensis]SMC58011.1 Peroxiredoxin [Pedobacter nyackensis]
MKKVLLLLCLLPFVTLGQQNFILNAKLRPLPFPAKAFLYYTINGKTTIDSTNIKDGVFTFNGALSEVAQAYLKIKRQTVPGIATRRTPSDLLDFFLESGTTTLSSKNDSVSAAVVKGSVVNDDVAKCKAIMAGIQTRAGKIMSQYKSGTPEQLKDSIYTAGFNEQLKTLDTEAKNIHANFMRSNRDSYYSLILFKTVVPIVADPLVAEAEFAKFSSRLKSGPLGKRIQDEIYATKLLALGQPAMDFTQNDINGKAVKLSDFKGKYVLLDFWASWCAPCRQENPNVVKVYQKYKNRNFTVLGVSLDNAGLKAAWLKAIKDDGLSWTNVSDLKGADNEVAVKYFVKTIPGNFLIGPDGKILAKNLRGDELEQKIAELLNDKNSRL